MNEFTPQQLSILERLVAKEFKLVAFPLYANAVGVRKGSCAALLDPIPSGGFRVFGEPCVLLEGNLTVRITEKGRTWFVWKKQRLEATPERVTELTYFVAEIQLLLDPHA
jgi:hypothetical protein